MNAALSGGPPRTSAFGLVENLVALTILSIGLLGSGGLLAEALAQLRANAQHRSAVVLGEELADLLISARAQVPRSAVACSAGIDDCFADPSLQASLRGWRSRIDRQLPGAGVQLSILPGDASVRYRIDIAWRAGGLGPASQRFEVILGK